jgi:nucleoside-diphosphate-sugar epimerase
MGNLLDGAALVSALAGVTTVVHLAGTVRALTATEFTAGNQHATANLVAAMQRRATKSRPMRLVYVSSLAAAGPSHSGASSARPPLVCAPVSAYGESKRNAGLEVSQAGPHVRWVVLRPPVVYGPGDRDLLPMFRLAAYGWFLAAGPDASYSVLFVEDAVTAILAALERPAVSGFLPLAGANLGRRQLVLALAEACGRRVRTLRLPLWIAASAGRLADLRARWRGAATTFSSDKVREIAAGSWVADGAPAQDALGFSATTPTRDGFARTIAWYRQQGLLAN